MSYDHPTPKEAVEFALSNLPGLDIPADVVVSLRSMMRLYEAARVYIIGDEDDSYAVLVDAVTAFETEEIV